MLKATKKNVFLEIVNFGKPEVFLNKINKD